MLILLPLYMDMNLLKEILNPLCNMNYSIPRALHKLAMDCSNFVWFLMSRTGFDKVSDCTDQQFALW